LLQVECLWKIAVGVETGKPIQRIVTKTENLAHFADCAAAAIGDDIRVIAAPRRP